MTNVISFADRVRTTCNTEGCDKPAQYVGRRRKDGSKIYRKYCGSCHIKTIANNAGKTVTQYTNSFHPYRKFRKDYCENIDGRLGFNCTTTIIWDGMLDVDHKDGNPSNNTEENCQTLCKCCHAYKTNLEKDYMTPGRKVLGIKY